MKASDRQEGGQHYKDFPIQPAEFCQRNRLNWCEANVVKYVCRHAEKKGAEDLRKAKHYLDLLLEWEYPEAGPVDNLVKDTTAASLCHTCQRNKMCVGEYPMTKDGGCEGYVKAETGVHISEWFAKEVSKSKEEKREFLCMSCYYENCSKSSMTEAKDSGECNAYTPTAQQDTPTAAERPAPHTDPAVNCKDCGTICNAVGTDTTMDYCNNFTPKGVESLDLVQHLHRQRAFSLKTFGPGPRTKGVVDHIRKELTEIEADPSDLYEWVDLVLLSLDGAWRAGHSPEAIADAITAKQTKNEGRTWPDWRTADPDKAIEHDRSGEADA